MLQVQWLFNNELISKDYQLQTFGDVHSLHIPAVQDKDAGRFSVIAENSSGKAWCSALLVVVETSQLMPDEGSPPETPVGPYIQPVVGPMPLHSKVGFSYSLILSHTLQAQCECQNNGDLHT